MDREKFLKAEEIARNLAETLVKLKAEIDLFKTTSDSLRDVRESLRNIVSMLEEVARGHFKVVEGFLGLKGPEIVEKLDALEEVTGKALRDIGEISGRLEKTESELSTALMKLDDLKNSATETLRQLEDLSGRLESMEVEYRRSIGRVMMFIYFVLAFSALSAFLALLAFLR